MGSCDQYESSHSRIIQGPPLPNSLPYALSKLSACPFFSSKHANDDFSVVAFFITEGHHSIPYHDGTVHGKIYNFVCMHHYSTNSACTACFRVMFYKVLPGVFSVHVRVCVRASTRTIVHIRFLYHSIPSAQVFNFCRTSSARCMCDFVETILHGRLPVYVRAGPSTLCTGTGTPHDTRRNVSIHACSAMRCVSLRPASFLQKYENNRVHGIRWVHMCACALAQVRFAHIRLKYNYLLIMRSSQGCVSKVCSVSAKPQPKSSAWYSVVTWVHACARPK